MPKAVLEHERHQRFVAEYLVDLSVAKAWVRCGYKAQSARVNAYRVFVRPDIQAAIRAALAKTLAEVQLTPAKILQDLEEVRLRAMGEGQYTAATRAIELQARYVNAFPEQSLFSNEDAAPEGATLPPLADLARGLAFVLASAQRAVQPKPATKPVLQ